MSIPYWTRNNRIVGNRKVNKTFHEVLHLSPEELRQWIDDLRAFVLEVWQQDGTPPLVGKSKEQIEDEFLEIRRYDVSRLRRTDEADGERNVLESPTNIGPCVNQFFPSMLMTKINGHSVYDEFADNLRFRRRARKPLRRQLRRDSFHRYSWAIERNSEKSGIMRAKSGAEWIKNFSIYPRVFGGCDFWLSDKLPSGTSYTQINPDDFLWLNKDQIHQGFRKGYLSRKHLTNVRALEEGKRYWIRLYKKSTRIFPAGFAAFRLGHQAAVNFPSLVAKFLIDRYTADVMDQEVVTIYDCCAGWGGRLLGALALDDRRIRYVGTDPNTDNLLPELRTSRYKYLADMFLEVVGDRNGHSVDIFQEGSEEIRKNARFQTFKGTVDLAFSSPPYYRKETYSNDETQSAIKFPEYPQWRNGFLRPTLETCVEWLRPGGYLAWNIADVRIDGREYALEDHSNKILESLGMKRAKENDGIWKMVVANMSGQNRIDEHGDPTTKHWCVVNGKKKKYEPVFVWRKPG